MYQPSFHRHFCMTSELLWILLTCRSVGLIWQCCHWLTVNHWALTTISSWISYYRAVEVEVSGVCDMWERKMEISLLLLHVLTLHLLVPFMGHSSTGTTGGGKMKPRQPRCAPIKTHPILSLNLPVTRRSSQSAPPLHRTNLDPSPSSSTNLDPSPSSSINLDPPFSHPLQIFYQFK